MDKAIEGEYIAKGEYDPSPADLQGGARTKEQMHIDIYNQMAGAAMQNRGFGNYDPFGDNPYNNNPQSGMYRRVNTFA